MLAIGLMSGTSLDGVDACLVNIKRGKFKLVDFITYPYSEDFKKKIMRNLSNDTAKLAEVSSLNFEIADMFVKAIDVLLEKAGLKYRDISFVASHGQTIWHDPKGEKCENGVPNTLQIGTASLISYKTKIKVVSNFRCADICAGGEGAPLIPFSEYYLYKSKTKNLVFQNIGGISNLTYIKAKAKMDDVISFDNGVGNIMIDYFTNKYFNVPFDKDGEIAFKGKVIDEVLDYLKQDEYIYKPYPKSTGREKYSKEYMEDLASKLDFDKYNKEDIVATITEFTAFSIAYSYTHFLSGVDMAIVSGGGSHNKYLMKRISDLSGILTITGDDYGINADAKEALGFAVLGYMTLKKKPSNIKSATGAKEDVILGDVTYAK